MPIVGVDEFGPRLPAMSVERELVIGTALILFLYYREFVSSTYRPTSASS